MCYVMYLYCIFQIIDQSLAVEDSQALSVEPVQYNIIEGKSVTKKVGCIYIYNVIFVQF